MNLQIKKATRKESKLKIALIGISGSGKSFSALAIAKGLGPKVLVVDSEHGSASKYAEFDFDTVELESFSPDTYTAWIREAERLGYDVVVLDSLSHAWTGKDGALEQVDKAARRSQGNSYVGWRDVTPMHNQLIDTIVGSRIHVIATMRAKTEYVQEKNANGKMQPRKIGLAPVQRDGMEYEFDIVGDIDAEHNLIITKTRCSAVDQAVINRPGAEFAATLLNWLNEGIPQRETYDVANMSFEELSALAKSLRESDPNHPQMAEIRAEGARKKAAKVAAELSEAIPADKETAVAN